MEEEIDTGISGYFSVSVFSIYLGSFSRVDVRLWKNKDLRFSRIICRRPDETIPVSSGLSLGLEHRGVRSPAPGSDHRQTSVFGGLCQYMVELRFQVLPAAVVAACFTNVCWDWQVWLPGSGAQSGKTSSDNRCKFVRVRGKHEVSAHSLHSLYIRTICHCCISTFNCQS